MVPGIEHKRLVSFDGTEIAYQVRGEGPAVVFSNGLGGTYEAFTHLYAALGERYRTICWHYRGLFDSGIPDDKDTLAVPYHCDDLELILKAEGISRAVFVGWSMGVQVNFEYFRERRDAMDGLVVINGTYGSPFNSVLSSRIVRYAIPTLIKAIRTQSAVAKISARTMVAWDGAVPMMQRFGLVAKQLDVEAFRAVAASFSKVDWKVYMDVMARLGEHDARDVLSDIDMPTLVIVGDQDMLTPAFVSEKIHRAVKGSRLVVIPGGTHYTPVEYPKVVTREFLEFLAKIPGYAPQEEWAS